MMGGGRRTWSMMRKDGLSGKGIFPRMKPLKKKLTNAPMAICRADMFVS